MCLRHLSEREFRSYAFGGPLAVRKRADEEFPESYGDVMMLKCSNVRGEKVACRNISDTTIDR